MSDIFDDKIDLLHPAFYRNTRREKDDPWPNAKNSRGPARKPGWSVIISVVNWCIEDLYQGREPQWKVIRVCTSVSAADKAASRLRTEYEPDLPKGEWRFKVGEVFPNGTAQILAKYSPRKFSEVANIPGVPQETRDIWVKKLEVYAQNKRNSV